MRGGGPEVRRAPPQHHDRKAEQAAERRFAETLSGTENDVLWEQVTGASPAGFIVSGYSDNYMRVSTAHPRDLTNVITTTQLGIYTDGAIHGTVKEIAPP